MCKFFSLVSDGNGKIMYMDWQYRKDHLHDNNDSHTFIANHFGYTGAKEDTLNKYEYNPLTKVFVVDQINAREDDRFQVEKFCNELDFSAIVAPLILKPVVHPFNKQKTKATKKDIQQLKLWDSILASVRDSVRDSIWDSAGDSVGDFIWDSVGVSIWDSILASVRDSVGVSIWDSILASVRDSVGVSILDSVRDSVGDSILASVRDSVWAYWSTFFNIKYDYDFESNLKLWESGLVPSYDGTTWRLHGKGGMVVFVISQKDLRAYPEGAKDGE